VEAVDAAFDMHEPVFTAVHGGEGERFYQFAFDQFGGTYGAGLGFAGETLGSWLAAPLPAETAAVSPRGDAYAEKEGKAEPEQSYPD